MDLILFAGGDGTARNICAAVADEVPVIGVPAGVKIHSAVYATTPAAAGDVCCLYLHERPAAVQLRECEVMDIDEEAFRENRVSAHLYGYMRVPYHARPRRAPRPAGWPANSAPSTTSPPRSCPAWSRTPCTSSAPAPPRGRSWSASGCRRRCSASTPYAPAPSPARTSPRARCSSSLAAAPRAYIVVTVIGGQGHVFGRGNQQISPAVIRAVGPGNVIVIATQTKLLSLEGRPLLVDTGDPALDEQLAGYAKVVTALGERTMYKVGA